ncbi:DUF115 domain-containing protein [Cyanobium sp. FGCU-52]|nr:DUF115 domain-containing protein [Cyanobium sp. FGCU52]
MSRYSENQEFISAVNPAFLEALPDEADNPWELILDEAGDPVNLKHRQTGELLYGGPGPQIERQNFASWAPSPARLVINDYQDLQVYSEQGLHSFREWTGTSHISDLDLESIHDLNLDLQPSWAIQRIAGYVDQHGLLIAPAALTSDGCALVVMGIGLGSHLEDLINYCKPSALFIVEPDLGMLERSMHVVDYVSIIQRFTGADKALDFVISDSPEAAVAQIRSLLTVRNLFLVDGLFSFITYDKNYFRLAKQLLHSPVTLNGINYLGYFLDEVHMIMNAAINYRFHRPKVFNSTKVRDNAGDAVVVASGPSLADDIEMLKRERDRFTIFCCYSTIGKLLDAGIVPDYHCDLERHNDHIPLIERGFVEQLKDIKLCCSSTCDPRLLGMYKEVYAINRGALTPSAIFTQGNDIIPNEGPDVATFAILCAIFFGFRRVHLFGVDLGTADRSVCRLPGVLDIDRRSYDLPVRGNRGRTVFSGQLLLDNKVAIESNIHFYSQTFPNLKVWNYSNGVLIDGAEPSTSEQFIERLEHNTPGQVYPPPAFEAYSEAHVDQAWKLADIRVRCFRFLNDLRSLAENPFDISTLYRVSDLCNVAQKSLLDQIPIRFYRGSLFRTWMQLLGVYNRAYFADPEARDAGLQALQKESTVILNEVIDSFESLTFAMVDYVDDLKSVDDFTFESRLQRDKLESQPLMISGSV